MRCYGSTEPRDTNLGTLVEPGCVYIHEGLVAGYNSNLSPPQHWTAVEVASQDLVVLGDNISDV